MINTKNFINVRTRFSEVDMMRVVHHSNYWTWFEESRFAFLTEILGISIDGIESSNIMMPVISCNCNYIQRIKRGDELQIITRLELTNAPYFIFHHEIYLTSDRFRENVLCKAWTKQAFIDENFKLKLKMPQVFSQVIKESFSKAPAAFIVND
jgi:acyl-CoA thioester hydrolase